VRRGLGIITAWGTVTVVAVTVAWLGVRASGSPTLAEVPNLLHPVPKPSLMVTKVLPPVRLAPRKSPARQQSARATPTPKGTLEVTLSELAINKHTRGFSAEYGENMPSPTSSPTPPTPTVTPTTPTVSPTTPSILESATPLALSTPTAAPTTNGPQVRRIKTYGGYATVSHTRGQIDLIDLEPRRGYTYEAYRLAPDCVVIRFTDNRHLSTIHAFRSANQQLTITVYEDDY
jgi:hypothetical protein